MSYEPINIFVRSLPPNDVALAGVLVKIFDQSGVVAFAELETDDGGIASCLLPAPNVFQVRCFKQQVAFRRPSLVEVIEAPAASVTNDFVIRGEPFVPPTTTDPRLCVVSGFFRQPDGTPAAQVDVHFIAKFDPLLLEGNAILTERVRVRTDKNGYARVTLIRDGRYDVTVEGAEDMLRTIDVPDRGAANLPDLLFPVVEAITFAPPPPYNLSIGEERTIVPTVVATSGKVLEGTALGDIFWRSSDRAVLGIFLTPTTITLRGIAAGQAQLTADRSDDSIVRIPATPVLGVPAQVMVT